ncbi:hypothetical protein JTB14_022362 [Gonioctena quinquepunctata]|nr:hypothetical protein JTB14_022362 [Gonioctena quinquepunctata]
MQSSLIFFVFLVVNCIYSINAFEPGDRVWIVSKKTGKVFEANGNSLTMEEKQDNKKQIWIIEGTVSGDIMLENAAYTGKVLTTSIWTGEVWASPRHMLNNQKFTLQSNGILTTRFFPEKCLQVFGENVGTNDIGKGNTTDVLFNFEKVLNPELPHLL